MESTEEEQLRSAALQNVQTILAARQKAEQELLDSKEALERSLAMMRATLESTSEALLATDEEGNITQANGRFYEMWGISEGTNHRAMSAQMSRSLSDPGTYMATIEDIYVSSPEETAHLLEFADGRVIERISKIQRVEGRNVGRVWSYRDLTERVQAEKTRSRLAAVVESSDDAIVSKTLEGVITTWNTGATRLFGYEPSEVIGKPITIIIPENLQSEEPEILRKIRAGDRIDHYETVRLRKDGGLIDVSLTVSPVRDANGKVTGVSKIARDISERKKIEEALKDEAKILEFINDTGRSIASQLDLQSLVQVVTDAATEITGAQFGAFFYNVLNEDGESYTLYTLSGAPKEAFESFGLPRNTPVFDATFKGTAVVRSPDITQDPRYGTMPPHYGMPKGHLPVRSYLAVPVSSRSGEVIGGLFFGHSEANVFTERAERIVVGIASQSSIAIDNAVLYESAQNEIKERSRAEAALRDSEEHLRAMFNQAAVGIVEVGLDGKFKQVNLKFCDILGYTPEELLDCTTLDLTHPDDLVETKQTFGRLAASEIEHYSYEKRFMRKDGSAVWVLSTVTLILDSEGNPQQFVGVIEDISTRKEVEIARQELLESERAARMEAEKLSRIKDEFLATLSHELRTPLNAILGWTYIIAQSASDEGLVREGIDVVDRNARIQTQLVSDLLDVSRMISGKMRLDVQQIQLPSLIESAVDSILPSADAKGVRVEMIVDPVADIIHGDPNRLQQILWNLLSNAVKFTPSGGKVQIILSRVDSHIEITVSDTGKGIQAEFLPHLFERFSQQDSSAAREHGGLGIGLALVKQLVELHGGKVRAHSDGVGKGASFTVEIPLAVALPPNRSHLRTSYDRSNDGDLPDLAGLTVLVVDDELDARAILRRILEDAGAKVLLAGSVDEGMALLAQKPDILVSDIGMPGRDGYQFIKQVRDAGHAMPAAALTAFARSSDRTKALLAGFHAHVGKPVEPIELLATIASLAGRTSSNQG